MNKQANVGNNIQVTLMIPKKSEIIRKLGSGESQSGFIQNWIIKHPLYKETEGPTAINYGIKWKCEGPSQVTNLKQPKLVQVDETLYKWFTGMQSEEKPITGPLITVMN
jgi:hypothetical protein